MYGWFQASLCGWLQASLCGGLSLPVVDWGLSVWLTSGIPMLLTSGFPVWLICLSLRLPCVVDLPITQASLCGWPTYHSGFPVWLTCLSLRLPCVVDLLITQASLCGWCQAFLCVYLPITQASLCGWLSYHSGLPVWSICLSPRHLCLVDFRLYYVVNLPNWWPSCIITQTSLCGWPAYHSGLCVVDLPITQASVWLTCLSLRPMCNDVWLTCLSLRPLCDWPAYHSSLPVWLICLSLLPPCVVDLPNHANWWHTMCCMDIAYTYNSILVAMVTN